MAIVRLRKVKTLPDPEWEGEREKDFSVNLLWLREERYRSIPSDMARYANPEKREQNATDTYGKPCFEVLKNILGAFPTLARPS